MNEVVFEVKGEAYKIRKPTGQEYREAKKVYNRAFNDAIASKSPLKARVNSILTEQGLWGPEKQAELEAIGQEIADKTFQLQAGGMKLTEARKIAIEISKLRVKSQALAVPIVMFNQQTAEGQADNARFDYLFSVCLVYLDGRQYFNSLEDYLNTSNDDEVVGVAARKFAEEFYGHSDDSDLPENEFLREYKFVDENYRLINKDGHLVDEDGKLVNEEGRYVDVNDKLVDEKGREVDVNGNYIVERKPFLNDDDTPIVDQKTVTADSTKDTTESTST